MVVSSSSVSLASLFFAVFLQWCNSTRGKKITVVNFFLTRNNFPSLFFVRLTFIFPLTFRWTGKKNTYFFFMGGREGNFFLLFFGAIDVFFIHFFFWTGKIKTTYFFFRGGKGREFSFFFLFGATDIFFFFNHVLLDRWKNTYIFFLCGKGR